MSCPHEKVPQSAHSPGVISNDELICRGALDGSHGNKKSGVVRHTIIDKKALADGHLSIFRAGGNTGWGLADVAAQLQSMKLIKPLFKVLGVSAGTLRAIKVGGVNVCIVDETECDDQGNHHKLHGHVTPCRLHAQLDPTTDQFDQLRLGIWTEYQATKNFLVVS